MTILHAAGVHGDAPTSGFADTIETHVPRVADSDALIDRIALGVVQWTDSDLLSAQLAAWRDEERERARALLDWFGVLP